MKEIQQHLMLDTFFQSQSDSFLLRAPRKKSLFLLSTDQIFTFLYVTQLHREHFKFAYM